MRIEQWARAMGSAGVSLSADELLDILWLARQGPVGAARTAPDQVDGTVTAEPPTATGAATFPAPESPAPVEDVFSYGGPSASGSRAQVVDAPAERALPQGRELARSFRRFKRLRPRPGSCHVDEEASAALVAETGVFDVVTRPARDRWLEAVLIVDDGVSMRIWQDAYLELRQLLEGLGAFRSVRCLGLDTRVPTPVLRARPFAEQAPVLPLSAATPPRGEAVLFVLSDGVGAAWTAGRIGGALLRWAERVPLALLQPLPPRLWASTGLAPGTALLRAPYAGAPNSTLSAELPFLPREFSAVEGVPVPVLDLQPGAVSAWAGLVVQSRRVALPVVPVNRARITDTAQRAAPPADLGTVVARFRRAASVDAFRLAAHLAAVRPLSLGVMRAVQRALFGRVDPAALAEVLLGGLMRQIRTSRPREPMLFEFRPGVRDLLLESVPAADALELAELVGRGLQQPRWDSRRFPVLRADPAGNSQVRPGGTAFAVEAVTQFFAGADPAGGPLAPDSAVEARDWAGAVARDRRLNEGLASEDWALVVSRGRRLLLGLARALGPDHPEVLQGRRQLAGWTGEAGAPQTAERELRELQQELAERFGAAAPLTLAVAAEAAEWTGKSGNARVAVDRLGQVLRLLLGALGPDAPECLAVRGRLCFWVGEVGDPYETLAGYLELLAEQERLLGGEDLRTLNTRANVASWTGQAGDPGEARDLCQALVADVERLVPADHPLRAISRAELAAWTAEAGEIPSGLGQLQDVLPELEESLGRQHSYPYVTRCRIAHWTGALGDLEGARVEVDALVDEVETVLPVEHPVLLRIRLEQVSSRLATGDLDLARQLLAELMPDILELLSPRHPLTVEAQRLGSALRDDRP